MSNLFEESNNWQGIPKAIQYRESSQKQTPYMEVEFDVQGHRKFVQLWLSEKAEERTMKLLADLGFNGDFENPTLSRTEPCNLQCKHEEWNGKVREKWGYFGEREVTPIDRNQSKVFAAKFKNAAAATKVPKPTTPMSKPPAPPVAAPTTPPKPPAGPAKPEPATMTKAETEDAAWGVWCTCVTDEEARRVGWLEAVGKFNPKDAKGWQQVADLATGIPF